MTSSDANEPGDAVEQAVEAALSRVLGALHPPFEIDGLTARAMYEPEPEHRGNPGWLHGGNAATLLDHICARRCQRARHPVVTGTLDLRYRQPVPLAGGPYVLEATAEPSRRRTVRVAGALRRSDGTPLVEAKALFVTLPD
ncbi:MAG: PaaI family thioesterase [Acidimicrobiales bacterium]